jgi:hypothetical protein
MPALSSLKRPDPVPCPVQFGGETVNIVFDRNRMTQRWVKQIQDGIATDDIEIAARSLVELLLEWDVLEEDGTPTPITVQVLADLPLAFIHALDDAVGEAGVPSSEEGNALSERSAVPDSGTSKEDSPTSLNGSETSTLQNASASPS